MHAPSIVTVLAALPAAMACLGSTGGVPKATGSTSLSAPKTLKKGEVFDAGWVRYDRGVKCTGQAEGGKFTCLWIVGAADSKYFSRFQGRRG